MQIHRGKPLKEVLKLASATYKKGKDTVGVAMVLEETKTARVRHHRRSKKKTRKKRKTKRRKRKTKRRKRKTKRRRRKRRKRRR